MTHNFTRRPIGQIEENRELLKSIAGDSYHTPDFKDDPGAEVPTAVMAPQYRTPHGRVSGNRFFRRYPDGMLDIDYAAHKVIDAIHTAKKQLPCSPEDTVALQIMFPSLFPGLDSGMVEQMAAVQLDLLPQEREMVRRKVAAHFAEELNWNAGQGGGSVPGRSQTYA
jgi:hypothetical protein